MFKRLVDWLGSLAKRFVFESRKPAIGYESTVVFFGGRLEQQACGKILFRMSGFISRLDRFGDWIVRRWDDAVPWQGGSVWRILRGQLLRYRGNPEQIWCNVRRLELSHCYEYHPDGVMILAHEKMRRAVSLQDIYRLHHFEWVDRREAVIVAAKFLADSHSMYGHVGEVLPSDILFGHVVEGQPVADPFWSIPDIVGAKGATAQELASRDLLDFVFSVTFEEYRRTQDFVEAWSMLSLTVHTYGRKAIIHEAYHVLEKGMYTLPQQGDGLFATAMYQHNRARLNPPCDGQSLQELIAVVLGEMRNLSDRHHCG